MFSILSFGSSLAQCLPEILSEEKCVNVAKVYQQRALRKDDSGSKMLIEPIQCCLVASWYWKNIIISRFSMKPGSKQKVSHGFQISTRKESTSSELFFHLLKLSRSFCYDQVFFNNGDFFSWKSPEQKKNLISNVQILPLTR